MSQTLTRRVWLTRLAAAVPVAALVPSVLRAQARVAVEVYKDPSCGCCEKWVEHMKASGFAPTVHNTSDIAAIKTKYKVTSALESCHTAIVQTYVIEGHVPANLIHKLVKEKPAVIGLAVPGMPMGSPGMEGGKPEPYSVLTFDKDGKTTVYAKR